MDWIDDAASKSRELRERERRIVENEEGIFNDLWSEVVKHVADARSHFPTLVTNGNTHARIVCLKASAAHNVTEKKLTIELESRHAIRVWPDGQRANPVFWVDISDDGVMCLNLNDSSQGMMPISMKDAAIMILRPFLFPELE